MLGWVPDRRSWLPAPKTEHELPRDQVYAVSRGTLLSHDRVQKAYLVGVKLRRLQLRTK